MSNHLVFDIVCKYDKKTESFYGGVPSLGIELTEQYSEGELLERAITAVREFFNGIMKRPNGDYVEFDAAVASVKLKVNMRVTKNQTLDNFNNQDESDAVSAGAE